MRTLSSDEVSLVSGGQLDTDFSHGDLHIYPWMPPPRIPYLPAIPSPTPGIPHIGPAPEVGEIDASKSYS